MVYVAPKNWSGKSDANKCGARWGTAKNKACARHATEEADARS
jgi:hypothetical protein